MSEERWYSEDGEKREVLLRWREAWIGRKKGKKRWML